MKEILDMLMSIRMKPVGIILVLLGVGRILIIAAGGDESSTIIGFVILQMIQFSLLFIIPGLILIGIAEIKETVNRTMIEIKETMNK